MKLSYDEAFDRVVGHEGGFQDSYHDRGNWTTGEVGRGGLKGTKWGISAMTYPHLDIPNLSKEEAKQIYYEDFWLRVGGDDWHPSVMFQLFDCAVNSGIGNTIRILQRALKVADDGHIGPVTKRAVEFKSVDDVLKLFLAERLEFMTKLSVWDRYGRGWARRIAENLRHAAGDFSPAWQGQVDYGGEYV